MTPAAMIEHGLAAAKVALQSTSLPLPICQTDERLRSGARRSRTLAATEASLCNALLGAKSALEQINPIIKKPPREILEPSMPIAPCLNHFRFIAETEAEHLVWRTAHGSAARHKFLHLFLRK